MIQEKFENKIGTLSKGVQKKQRSQSPTFPFSLFVLLAPVLSSSFDSAKNGGGKKEVLYFFALYVNIVFTLLTPTPSQASTSYLKGELKKGKKKKDKNLHILALLFTRV